MINFSFEAHELYIPGLLDNIIINIMNESIKKCIYSNGHVDAPSIRVMLPCKYYSGYKKDESMEYFIVQFDYNVPNMHIIIIGASGKIALDRILTHEGYDAFAVETTLRNELKYTGRHMIIDYIFYIMDHVVNMLK